MRIAIVTAWMITFHAVLLLSLAPISLDGFPGESDLWFSAGHTLAYAVLTPLTYALLLQIWKAMSYWPAVLIAATATILFSGLIEILQPYFGRQRDINDLMLNILGVTVAVLVMTMLRRRGAMIQLARP